MRHKKGNTKLGLPTDQRLALLRNGVLSLIQVNKITTTHTRAKAIARLAEKLITMSKHDTVQARRNVYKYIPNRTIIKQIFTDLAVKYKEVSGGYTRITRIGIRKGDAAPISLLELL